MDLVRVGIRSLISPSTPMIGPCSIFVSGRIPAMPRLSLSRTLVKGIGISRVLAPAGCRPSCKTAATLGGRSDRKLVPFIPVNGRETEPAIVILAANLKFFRHEQKLSVRELGERAGLDYRHISKIECGTWPDVQLSTLGALARGLNMPCWKLLRPRSTRHRKAQ